MSNTQDLQPTNMTVLVVGPPKSGKTRFLGTWPKPFIYSFDGSITSLAGKDIDYELFQDDDRYKPEAFMKFVTHLDDKINAIQAGTDDTKTIGLDNLTFLSRSLMNYIQYMHRTIDKPPGFEGYRMFKSKMLDIITKARLSGVNLVATAEEKMDKDENTGEIETVPAIEGSYREEVVADFDMAFYMRVSRDPKTKMPLYLMQTVPDHRIKCAGSRWDCGLAMLEIPDYAVIIAKIKERFPTVKI